MKHHQIFALIWLSIVAVIGQSCNLPTPTIPPIHLPPITTTPTTPTPTCFPVNYARILQPTDGARLLPGSYTIRVHVGDKGIFLKINGVLVGSGQEEGPGPFDWEFDYVWTPSATGMYLIEAQSEGYSCPDGSPWDQVHVTIYLPALTLPVFIPTPTVPKPLIQPSYIPFSKPTGQPTPTNTPSSKPNNQPTNPPSGKPGGQPTNTPCPKC